jgi:uracil-DNA glycosylase
MTTTFSHQVIDQKYRDLGFEKGWTFLACSEARLFDAKIALVGLNPGGGGVGDDYAYAGNWSCNQNAFYDEASGHQSQIQEWHRILGVQKDETLCAQFIPFRSPNLKGLKNQDEAIAFSRDLWTWVLRLSPATLFLAMGKLAAHHLANLMDAAQIEPPLPTGWGRQAIEVWEAGCGRRVIGMPHPSRYKLFGRGTSSVIAEASLRRAAGMIEPK